MQPLPSNESETTTARLTTPQLVPGASQSEDEARLNGLREPLEEVTDEHPQPISDEQINESIASIYSKYREHADQEDKELTNRWTETLNILLTFAGLQSAVITAFLVGGGLGLKPDTLDQTNELLLHILHKLDNSTTILPEATPWSPAHSDIRISAWWFTSLACSLLSAFGALSSKQWVMHYQSRPGWANTIEKQCQLREMRHQGLINWWFHAIIELLPILLQLSVLFFAVGLVDYLQPISSLLFNLVLSFLCIGAILFVLALISGIFYPSCPFKSPITDAIFQAIGVVDCFLSLLPDLLSLVVVVIAERIIPTDPAELGDSDGLLSTVWRLSTDFNIGLLWKRRTGLESPHVGSAGATGILCWWLAAEDGRPDEPEAYANAAVQELIRIPVKTVMDVFQTMGIFVHWSTGVIQKLDSIKTVPPQRNVFVQMQDLLCHLLYHSPTASWIVLNVNNEFQVLRTIRKTWCDTQTRSLLIAKMRRTTVAVFMRLQLRDWCSKRPGKRNYHDEILLELPIILQNKHVQKSLPDTSNAISLAAIALVEDNTQGVGSIEALKPHEPLEQLLEALQRLSFFDPSDPNGRPHKVVPLVVRMSIMQVTNIPQNTPTIIDKCISWKDGALAETLLRLLKLASAWARESGSGESAEIGHDLQSQTEEFLVRICQTPWTSRYIPTGWCSLRSMDGLATIFDAYSRTESTTSPKNHNMLKILDFSLGLHHYQTRNPTRNRISQSINQHTLQTTTPNPCASILSDHPTVVPQLVRDIQASTAGEPARLLLLSILVKGRDIFVPLALSDRHFHLSQTLAAIGSNMAESGSFLQVLDRTSFDQFQSWEDLVSILRNTQTISALNEDAETSAR